MTPAQTFDAITFVYLACAKLADGDLDRREAVVIGTKVRELCPDVAPADADAQFRATATRFWATDSSDPSDMRAAVLDAAAHLAELPEPRRVAIVRGMVAVTEADGKVTDGEFAYLHAVAERLGVEL